MNCFARILAMGAGILMMNGCKPKITPYATPKFLELSNDSKPVNRQLLWSGTPFAQISEYSWSGADRHISVIEDSINSHKISAVNISFDKNNRLKFITWSAKDDKTGNIVQQGFEVGDGGELQEIKGPTQ